MWWFLVSRDGMSIVKENNTTAASLDMPCCYY